MRKLAVLDQNDRPAILAPDYVQARVLAANVPELHTVPTSAAYVEIKATADAYALYLHGADAVADLVTNGAFAADTDWTKGTGWSIAAGVASSDASQVGDSDLEQDPANGLVEGRAYYVTFTVANRTAGNVTPVVGGTEGTDRSTNSTFSEIIVAGSGSAIALRADANFDGDVDDFSVVPCAQAPSAGQITAGQAAELIPAGAPVLRYIPAETYISLASASTPVVTMAFYGE